MFIVPRPLLAPLALVVAATLWGVVWYPYRLLEAAGLSGQLATLLTYVVALLVMLAIYRPGRSGGHRGLLLVVSLTAGWTNLAYVLAVIGGEIMRVLLLFYLAPLWTVLFARLLLGERAGAWGALVIAMALAGAVVMLHNPADPWPLPASAAEWLGLSAGVTYALSNVLSRRLKQVSTARRSVWIFAGVLAITAWPAAGEAVPVLAGLGAGGYGLLLLTGLALVLATLCAQYGLAHTPANRAIVILLSELLAAAVSSWYWAGEVMTPREWLGGGLIVAASLLSGKLERGENHA
ncbi:DMT family transporter [Parasulfuritortus cantonensis]|uniref:DMT family transporter n=1 Tax=Parasulfuritortus cantonensis TaxID=2528202 RepID=A0A4R1B954_9PROT|nr:DMT family transporter [Parasulfuritortus cantonensis]TCJ13183.1 DMT family transporter [Parasulfuritortus cantonensis]